MRRAIGAAGMRRFAAKMKTLGFRISDRPHAGLDPLRKGRLRRALRCHGLAFITLDGRGAGRQEQAMGFANYGIAAEFRRVSRRWRSRNDPLAKETATFRYVQASRPYSLGHPQYVVGESLCPHKRDVATENRANRGKRNGMPKNASSRLQARARAVGAGENSKRGKGSGTRRCYVAIEAMCLELLAQANGLGISGIGSHAQTPDDALVAELRLLEDRLFGGEQVRRRGA